MARQTIPPPRLAPTLTVTPTSRGALIERYWAYTVVAAGILTSLLTLYAVAKCWNLAFWRTPEQAHETAEQLSAAQRGRSSAQLVRHRGHVHVGAGTFEVRDVDEARSIVDEGDASNKDFHQLIEEGSLPSRLPRTMVGATAALIVLSLGLSVFAGSVFGYTGRAAHDILDNRVYISSVLPGGSS